MNNKEFISELSKRMGYSNKDATQFVSSVLNVMSQELQDGKSVVIQGFGSFDVKKKLERISVNPVTRQRMLIPPKLVLSYKPSITLKEKFKGSGLKLSADMAKFIIESGQKERFAEYQRLKDEINKNLER